MYSHLLNPSIPQRTVMTKLIILGKGFEHLTDIAGTIPTVLGLATVIKAELSARKLDFARIKFV